MVLSVSTVTYLGNEEKLPIDNASVHHNRSLPDWSHAILTSIADTCLQRWAEPVADHELGKS